LRRIDDVGAFWRIVADGAKGFVGISHNREQIVRVVIPPIEGDDVKIEIKIFDADQELNDVHVLSDSTIVGCSRSAIVTVNPTGDLSKTGIAKASFAAEVGECREILTFAGQGVFVVICQNGHLLIGRTTEVGKTDPYLQKKLHMLDIVTWCNGDEFSFLTCDVGGNAVLWENVPDWWDAPYQLNLFQDSGQA
jgi:hypothetical protein